MNTFGTRLRLSTFGESHGVAIGGMLDGLPSNVKINESFIQNELDKRKPGGKFATSRKESDKVQILSGVFDGLSTGCPIGFIIHNENQKSSHYENIKDIFRPGHADYTYFMKFGTRDYRGGGRSSARESAIRVCGGAISQLLLSNFDINVQSAVYSVGNISSKFENIDFKYAQNSEIYACSKEFEDKFKQEIINAKNSHNSVGGSVITKITGAMAGLGEVLYAKFDAKLAEAMMGINGVKGVEIGNGINSAKSNGFENNDFMDINGFLTNHSGGILGGITNGNEIIIKTHFKPTPSIFLQEPTIDINLKECICELKGRHDPCIAIRGSVVATAMARLVCADMLLLNASANLENLKKIYKD